MDDGRFKYLVLPPQITGAELLKLSSKGLAELFEMSLRRARGRGEGQAGNIVSMAIFEAFLKHFFQQQSAGMERDSSQGGRLPYWPDGFRCCAPRGLALARWRCQAA